MAATENQVHFQFPRSRPLGSSFPKQRYVKSAGFVVASGHTASNTPDLFRTPQLTGAGPGQY